jgi:hypothetical protein
MQRRLHRSDNQKAVKEPYNKDNNRDSWLNTTQSERSLCFCLRKVQGSKQKSVESERAGTPHAEPCERESHLDVCLCLVSAFQLPAFRSSEFIEARPANTPPSLPYIHTFFFTLLSSFELEFIPFVIFDRSESEFLCRPSSSKHSMTQGVAPVVYRKSCFLCL